MQKHKREYDESYYAFEGVDNTENLGLDEFELAGDPYLNLSDVKEIYITIHGSSKGFGKFSKEAKKVAEKIETSFSKSYFLFKDEPALFEVFKQFLKKELEIRKISSWGELMQYLS